MHLANHPWVVGRRLARDAEAIKLDIAPPGSCGKTPLAGEVRTGALGVVAGTASFNRVQPGAAVADLAAMEAGRL
jgi:hypothetical protein